MYISFLVCVVWISLWIAMLNIIVLAILSVLRVKHILLVLESFLVVFWLFGCLVRAG